MTRNTSCNWQSDAQVSGPVSDTGAEFSFQQRAVTHLVPWTGKHVMTVITKKPPAGRGRQCGCAGEGPCGGGGTAGGPAGAPAVADPPRPAAPPAAAATPRRAPAQAAAPPTLSAHSAQPPPAGPAAPPLQHPIFSCWGLEANRLLFQFHF